MTKSEARKRRKRAGIPWEREWHQQRLPAYSQPIRRRLYTQYRSAALAFAFLLFLSSHTPFAPHRSRLFVHFIADISLREPSVMHKRRLFVIHWLNSLPRYAFLYKYWYCERQHNNSWSINKSGSFKNSASQESSESLMCEVVDDALNGRWWVGKLGLRICEQNVT